MRTQPRIEPGAAPSGAPATDAPTLKAAAVHAGVVWLGVRLGLFVIAALAMGLLESNPPVDVPGWPAPEPSAGWHNLVTAWERWDALWFLRIAMHGYVEGDFSAAFFPLYPMLIYGAQFAFGGYALGAALFVSNLAFYLALVVFYLLTHLELGERAARRATLYLAVFPTAYFFFAPYSESVFLLLALTSVWAARRRRWPVAALAGALAAATRSVGLVLLPALAAEAVSQYRAERHQPGARRRLATALAGSGATALGTFAYLAYWRAQGGDWLTPVRNQSGWLREFSWPWDTLTEAGRVALGSIGRFPGGYHLIDWLILLPVAAAAVALTLKARPVYSIYVGASLVLPLLLVFGGRPLMSLPRFAAVMFPIFWMFSAFAERFRAHDAVVASSAAGLGILTLLFLNWYWVF